MDESGAQAAGGNGAARNDAVQGYLKRLLDYAIDSPAKTLSLTVLTYGGLLLLVYFGRIGFLPDVNLDAVASVLYAVALVGLLLAGYTATTLVMPGLLLGGNVDEANLPRNWVGWVAAASAVLWCLIVLGLLSDFSVWVWCAMAVAAVIAALTMAWRGRHMLVHNPKPWVWAALLTVVCSLLMAVPMALLSALSLYGDLVRAANWKAGIALVSMAIGIAATAWLVATTERPRRWKVALILAPSGLFIFSMLTGSFSAISVIAVNKLGLGEYHFVRAVVSGKTCKVVNEALGQTVCDPKAEDDAPTTICPAQLRSRIGSQVLLEFSGLKLDKSGELTRLVWAAPASLQVDAKEEPYFRRVVLPKDQLLTWSSVRQQVNGVESTPVSAMLATWRSPQPRELAKALAKVCGVPVDAAAPGEPSASSPAAAASAPTVIQIDAKGSASHQTVVNVQLHNAVSQNAAALAAAAAKSAAEAKTVVKRPPRPQPDCSKRAESALCCQAVCCGVPLSRDAGPPPPACAASAAG
jgi:hypothetical protein